MTPIHVETLQYNIPLELAVQYTTAWRTGSSSIKLNAIGFVKAFNIKREDIDQLYLLMPHDGSCRAYLGVDESVVPNVPKLLLVPVDADNNDILHIEGTDEDDSSGQSTIFDFTTPCPSMCAPSSVLAGTK